MKRNLRYNIMLMTKTAGSVTRIANLSQFRLEQSPLTSVKPLFEIRLYD